MLNGAKTLVVCFGAACGAVVTRLSPMPVWPAGDKNMGSSPGLGCLASGTFLRAGRRGFSPGTPVSSPSSK